MMEKATSKQICSWKEIINNPFSLLSFGEVLYLHMVHEEEDFNLVIQKVIQYNNLDEAQGSNIYAELLWHILNPSSTDLFSLNFNKVVISECLKTKIYINIIRSLKQFVDKIKNGQFEIEQETYLETSLKLQLTCLYYIFIQSQINEEGLKKIYIVQKDFELEEIFLKLISLSIKYQFIPIRKVVYNFNFFLRIEIDAIYEKVPLNRPFSLDFEKVQQIMQEEPKLLKTKVSQTERFYRRMIMNQVDSPLAQIIVVGLLRALLTTSSSSARSSLNNTPGVDIHKEWETYYKLMQNFEFPQEKFRGYLEQYKTHQQDMKNIITDEYDRQRINTCVIISDFMLVLISQLKRNCLVQCSYFIQLMTDANGVLVFLKFLTEKFNLTQREMVNFKNESMNFNDNLQRSIKNILKLMYITTNNYPDKIREFLVEYNAYLTIKKLPNQYQENEKIKKYSYLLLKIQIAMFNKKQRTNGNNMKMITEVFGKYIPKKQQKKDSEVEDSLKTMQLLEKYKLNTMELITAQEDLRRIHQEFNNYHYWKADLMKSKFFDEFASCDELIQKYKMKETWDKLIDPEIPQNFELQYEEWLEKNVLDYFD